MQKSQIKPVTAALALSLMAPVTGVAQDDADSNRTLEEIVVTGTTRKNVTQLESSVAITTTTAEEMARAAPLAVGEALEVVPGFWVEPSSGETVNNVAPRGLGGGAQFKFISIQEDGLPVIYDGYNTDTIQRMDLTIDRYEAIRGGTSGVLSVNGPASIVNWITKKGGLEPEGTVRLIVTDYSTFREEVYYGGPLSNDWSIAAGGYYRTSESPRETGFIGDHGGQFRINLTRMLDNGEINISAKHVDDNNTFFLPIPLQNTSDPTGVASLHPTSGTMVGPDLANTRHLLPRQIEETNLSDGVDVVADVLGVSIDLDMDNGWSFRAAAKATDYSLRYNAIFNGSNATLMLGEERLMQADVANMLATFAPAGATTAALRYATSGELIGDPSALNSNSLTAQNIAYLGLRDREQIVSDTRLTWNTDNNSLSFGLLYAYLTHDMFTTGSTFISDVKTHPDKLDIVALDAGGNVVGSLTDDGILAYGTFFTNMNADLNSYSLYINDEFQLSDRLRIDAGVRYESVEYYVNTEGNQPGQAIPGATDADGNDLDNVMANNVAANYGSGRFTVVNETFNELAWTVGFNYLFTDNFALYGRYADAFQTPAISLGAFEIADGVSGLTFTEVGARYQGDTFNVSATLFHTEFDNLPIPGTLTSTGEPQTIIANTLATGVEWEATWAPTDWLQFDAGGVFQDTEIDGIPSTIVQSTYNGNQVQRTPDTQVRITPTLSFGDNLSVFLTYHYYGDREADVANSLTLPEFDQIDAGVEYRFDDAWTLLVNGKNLGDSIGLTEGNPRSGFDEADGVEYFYARPVFGRVFQASITYDFF